MLSNACAKPQCIHFSLEELKVKKKLKRETTFPGNTLEDRSQSKVQMGTY